LLINEIFGEENFIGCFVWRRRTGSSLSSAWLSIDHEYVLAILKIFDQVNILGEKRDMDKYNQIGEGGRKYASMPLTVGMNKNMRPNQWYELKHPTTGKGYWPSQNRVWAYYSSTMKDKIQQNEIIWPDDFPNRKMIIPRLKSYPEDAKRETKPLSTWIFEKNQSISENQDSTIIKSGKTKDGSKVLNDLIGESSFVYPKPLSLISSLIEQFTKNGDIILDFFSGSATTAHAVLDLNKEDDGNRKFILVQLPEKCDDNSEAYKAGYKTIAEIGKERISRVIKKIRKEQKSKLDLCGDAQAGGYYLVNDNEIALILEKVNKKIIKKVIEAKTQKVIAIDRLFNNNDRLKTNTALQMKDAGIEFKVV
jgi:adenine-specific DNA-methyltransferase